MAEGFSNSLLSNSIYYLLNFEKYPSFPVAVKEGGINNNLQMALFSTDFNMLFAVETRHSISVEELVRARLDSSSIDDPERISLASQGVETFWRPVNVAGQRYYLMLLDNDNNFSPDDLSKLSEIIELAMGMWNYKPQRDLVAELISAVRRGNKALAYTLLDELGVDDECLCGVFYIPGAKSEEALKILVDFENDHDIKDIKLIEPDEISGILMSGDYLSPSTEEWQAMAEKLFKAGARMSFNVGNIQGIEGVTNAFRVINETEAFINLIFPYKRCFGKYELAMASNCVSICLNGGEVMRNYQELNKPFSQAKANKDRQLIDTLECFVLDAGLSTAKTARLMDVHVNTVQYRLKRIKEILGVDVSDNTVVPGLMMALAVSRIEKEVRSL